MKANKKVYIDETGITEGMSVSEKFKFLQNEGLIDKDEVVENWNYSSSEVDKDVIPTLKRVKK